MVDTVRKTVFDTCSTGTVGDGLVWVVDVGDIHRIRDREPVRPVG